MNYTIIDETTNISDEYCRSIYVNNSSLSKPLCNEIIKMYEVDNDKYEGVTKGGLDKNTKDTLDLIITDETKWIKIKKALHKELIQNLDKYVDRLNDCPDYLNTDQLTDMKFRFFARFKGPHQIPTFMIQRYRKNIGKFVYHDDTHNDYKNNRFRIITYIWYLNDVCEGGETVFSGRYAVKPTTGKLVLFPATWTYPHCGKMPISGDKYILTGWIYVSL
jgi:hypothetical protein